MLDMIGLKKEEMRIDSKSNSTSLDECRTQLNAHLHRLATLQHTHRCTVDYIQPSDHADLVQRVGKFVQQSA